MKSKKELIDDALAKICTEGEVAAMKWLANSLEANFNEEHQKLLRKVDSYDRIIQQMKNFG